MKHVLVFAPHPDDEVLGVGGTIAKHTDNGDVVSVVVISEGVSAQYDNPQMLQVRRDACKKACEILGTKNIRFFDLPDARLMETGLVEITAVMSKAMQEFKPDVVYAPDISELHMDHRFVYEATQVVTRPYLDVFKKGTVLFYETSSMKQVPFQAKYYVDITTYIDLKVKAFNAYDSEIEQFPHPRSIEAIRTLAKMRGAEAGTQFAEGFVVGRIVV